MLIAVSCTACSGVESTHLANDADCEVVSELNYTRDAILSTTGTFPQGSRNRDSFWNDKLDKYCRLGELHDDTSHNVTTQTLSHSLTDVGRQFVAIFDSAECSIAVSRECLADLNAQFNELTQKIDAVDEFCAE
ncbi:hypothetical protein [Tomitella cavernea]|uniref:hypothetical protein n=1 Tax=Tomitella cavernea TaxID=1387982 RepID=UPI0019048E10|nr:hypothetical protein [Tomitella cavernea]